LSTITGRWLARDPLQEEGGENLFAALGNDSVNFVDPLGLIEFPTWASLKHSPTVNIPLPPPWPSLSVNVRPYDIKGDSFNAEVTVNLSWGFPLGKLSRLTGFAVNAEVGFEGSGTLVICDGKLVKGEPTLTVGVFGAASLGAGSRTWSGSRGNTYRVRTPKGVVMEQYLPPIEQTRGFFGSVKISGSIDVNIQTKKVDNGKVTASVEGGYRLNDYFNYSFSKEWQIFP
jgi:hypothetical protein